MDEYPKRLGEIVDEGLQAAARTARRLAYVGFALLAFGLVLIGKIDARLIDGVRAFVADLSAPALDIVSFPLSVAEDLLEDAEGLVDLREENRRLREENAKLARLRIAAHQLKQENASLRRLLRFDTITPNLGNADFYAGNETDISLAGPEVPSLGWTYANLRVEFMQ